MTIFIDRDLAEGVNGVMTRSQVLKEAQRRVQLQENFLLLTPRQRLENRGALLSSSGPDPDRRLSRSSAPVISFEKKIVR